MEHSTQVLVIGGGPAGSTVATLLAREGFDVVLLERETFPRYHIGESMLPSCLPILDLLGVRQKIEDHGFQRKDGVYFEWGTEKWDFSFGELSGDRGYSFQVLRSEFDQLLLEHAKSQGVKVYEGIEVSELFFEAGRPKSAAWMQKSNKNKGEIAFEMLVDASGRAGIMATRYLQDRQYHTAFQNVALWGYWKGTKKLERGPQGAIAVGSIPNGWLWAIPLHDGTLSVGLVIHKTAFKEMRQSRSLEEIYAKAIEMSLLMTELTTAGERVTPLKIEQDYSYASSQFAGPGYFLAGDAACFLDPLLSTGVHLATFGALLAAASIASTLRQEVQEKESIDFYNQNYRHAYLRLMVLVSAFYQQNKGRDRYFWEAQQLAQTDYNSEELGQAFVSIVSGVEDLRDVEQPQPPQIIEGITKLYGEQIKIFQQKNELKHAPVEERENAIAKVRLLNSLHEHFALSAANAVNGLYVKVQSPLRLERINNDAQ